MYRDIYVERDRAKHMTYANFMYMIYTPNHWVSCSWLLVAVSEFKFRSSTPFLASDRSLFLVKLKGSGFMGFLTLRVQDVGA